jgi:hypothetical protein
MVELKFSALEVPSEEPSFDALNRVDYWWFTLALHLVQYLFMP